MSFRACRRPRCPRVHFRQPARARGGDVIRHSRPTNGSRIPPRLRAFHRPRASFPPPRRALAMFEDMKRTRREAVWLQQVASEARIVGRALREIMDSHVEMAYRQIDRRCGRSATRGG